MHIAQEAPTSPGLAPSAGWQGQDAASTAPAPERAEEQPCGLVRESWLQSAHRSIVSAAIVVQFQPQMLDPQTSLQRCHECCQGSATTCSDCHQSCHHPSLSATGGRLGRKCHHLPPADIGISRELQAALAHRALLCSCTSSVQRRTSPTQRLGWVLVTQFFSPLLRAIC